MKAFCLFLEYIPYFSLCSSFALCLGGGLCWRDRLLPTSSAFSSNIISFVHGCWSKYPLSFGEDDDESALRGNQTFSLRLSFQLSRVQKYLCCWSWDAIRSWSLFSYSVCLPACMSSLVKLASSSATSCKYMQSYISTRQVRGVRGR